MSIFKLGHLRARLRRQHSGSRESNPVCTNPNRAYCRHTPPRRLNANFSRDKTILIHNPPFVHFPNYQKLIAIVLRRLCAKLQPHQFSRFACAMPHRRRPRESKFSAENYVLCKKPKANRNDIAAPLRARPARTRGIRQQANIRAPQYRCDWRQSHYPILPLRHLIPLDLNFVFLFFGVKRDSRQFIVAKAAKPFDLAQQIIAIV